MSPPATGTVCARAVDSGVSEQPRGRAETIQGAKNRTRAVFGRDRRADVHAVGYDYGVGIEGGVATVDGADGLFLIMWAAVTDGKRVGLGAGPSLQLPGSSADRLRDGAELGPVMDDVLGTEGIKRRGGAVSVLTDGRLTREAALGPFVSDVYE